MTDAEAPTRWPPDMKSQLTEKDPGAGKDRGALVGYSPWGHKESDTSEQLSMQQGPTG